MFKSARGCSKFLLRGGAAYAIAANQQYILQSDSEPKLAAFVAPRHSWVSYISPVSWYNWSVYSSDDFHFQQYLHQSSTQGLMSWPSLVKGIGERGRDEELAKRKVVEAQGLIAKAKSMDAMEKKRVVDALSAELTEIMYGKGVTMEERQKYLAVYGCAPYTDEAIQIIADLAKEKGVIEMGAGNGQWARRLKESHDVNIIAFDSMANVPHPYLPNATASQSFEESKKYFGEVMEGDASLFQPPDKAEERGITGRALLIVFPDQGPMAFQCLKSYVSSSPKNDLFIYVGEGRGGANADDALFDWLEGGDWVVQQSVPLKPFGSKGFERLFVFKRT